MNEYAVERLLKALQSLTNEVQLFREQMAKTEPSFKVDEIGDDDPTIHAIAHLQKVGWLQEHDRALTEPQTEQWHYDEKDNTWYPYQHKSCATCKHALGDWDEESNNCGRCCGADRRFYEPIEDEQTERSE